MTSNRPYKPIIIWLYAVIFMVFGMVIIGAITRLMEAGLSIVEWHVVMGALPPLDEAGWQRIFELYKNSPEFAQKHYWMELIDFKHIFFWEWFHRLWGRMIGLVYALPMIWFWFRGQIPPNFKLRFLTLLFLGLAQGFVGWWMVQSGLVDMPGVSHYRLAVHLSLALIIFALLIWTVPDISHTRGVHSTHKQHCVKYKYLSVICLLLLSTTIIWGAFVAGLDAGQIYNSFPLMEGSFTPKESFTIPAIVEQRGWVQFTHRWLAITTAIFITWLAWKTRDRYLGGMVIIQVGLGISTLLTGVMLPLAVLHQAGAVILVGLLIKSLHLGWSGRNSSSGVGL